MAKQQKKSSDLNKKPLTVEYWPLEKIVPYAGNPRKRSKKAVAKVAASIKEFGWRQPIVVDEKGIILAGHTRRDAAEFLELKQAPVHQAMGLSAAQKRAFRIADNRTNEETEWDDDLLSVELKGLQGLNFDLSLTGFDLRAVSGYIRETPEGEPFERPDGDRYKEQYGVIVLSESEAEQKETFEKLTADGYKCRVVTT